VNADRREMPRLAKARADADRYILCDLLAVCLHACLSARLLNLPSNPCRPRLAQPEQDTIKAWTFHGLQIQRDRPGQLTTGRKELHE
jgi:hypothetical protein